MAIETVFDARRQKLLADQEADGTHVRALRQRIERLERLVQTLEQDKLLLARELEAFRAHRRAHRGAARPAHAQAPHPRRRHTAAA